DRVIRLQISRLVLMSLSRGQLASNPFSRSTPNFRRFQKLPPTRRDAPARRLCETSAETNDPSPVARGLTAGQLDCNSRKTFQSQPAKTFLCSSGCGNCPVEPSREVRCSRIQITKIRGAIERAQGSPIDEICARLQPKQARLWQPERELKAGRARPIHHARLPRRLYGESQW